MGRFETEVLVEAFSWVRSYVLGVRPAESSGRAWLDEALGRASPPQAD